MSDSNLNPQPLPPQQQPAGYQQQYQGAQPGWNTMSIVAFILSFIVNIVGIILGFIALNQIKRTGEQGRGLAIAAIIIGFVSVAFSIIFSIIFFASLGAAMSNYNYN
ncbi:protein of unknown function [Leifsonia sp. 98AMF]|uniref:DUF4190 domain-containing protein n=1 Tax=Microbacteriaceae TaxID=85023 RepID=UPI0003630744|nr:MULTISPECIES: DUF4190 domain-containing protein [Microbacteriaceae]TDP99979.1 uncharacterized protein DUF4190 [Leifsonia sp. 115AMFTsu3.1]SDH37100.1 protein of unknown function [Leifsonia sp. 197AMF]SDI98722.1 protein of unknown function [Leifsonia sp. 466MF]SDJ76027.1 protein of unknown function [Leifsonia sp. 157MF]SDO02006.1 protein of unknown function [Leifsonia sp. 509MF]